MRYSLADYILEIKLPESLTLALGLDDESISIGGEGSYLGNISIEHNSDLWSTSGDSTGSWIHIKNLDRSGTASLTINMLSPKSVQLTTILNLYYNINHDDEPMTLTLSDQNSTIVVTCISCHLRKLPAISFDNEPGTRNWVFTCGQIDVIQK